MIDNIQQAFLTSIEMLEDGIRKVPDAQWREGGEEYRVPVRIAYHVLMGLEWFVSTVAPREHIRTRRFNLSNEARGLAPVDGLPERQALLEDLAWITECIREWFTEWERDAAAGKDSAFRLNKALYFMRHTQHHIGEFSAAVRLRGLERPTWKFPEVKDLSVILEADGPAAGSHSR